MKKLLPITLFVAVLMMVSVWCIGWWMQARNLRATLEQHIAAIAPEIGALKAESISVDGFPFSMVIRFTNPTVTMQLDQLLSDARKRAMAAAGNSAGVLAAPEYPKGLLTVALTGSISIGSNALADALILTYDGSDTTTLTRDDGVSSLSTEYQGPFTCRMTLKRDMGVLFNQMWDLQKILTPEAIAERLTLAECRIPGGITTNSQTGQMASSIAPGHFKFSNQPTAERMAFSLDAALKEFEIFPAGDDVYNALRRAITPLNESYNPASMSLYGKQTIDLAASIDAPKNVASWHGKNYRVDVSRFNVVNAAGTTEGSLLLASTPSGAIQQGEVAMNLTAEFTPQQTAIARMSLTQFLDEMMQDEKFKQLYPVTDRAVLESALFTALPDITTLGTLTGKVALNFSVDTTKSDGTVNLTGLELSSRDFGITGNGTGVMGSGNPIPAVNASLLCRACLPMIDTVAGYMARAEQALASVNSPQAAMFHLPPEQVAGAKRFLSALGVISGAPENLNFIIKNNAGALSINDKSLPELMQLMQASFTPPASAE